jgi:CRP-like cAMP-binding protein
VPNAPSRRRSLSVVLPRGATSGGDALCPIGRAAGCANGGACPMTSRSFAAGTTIFVEGAQAGRVWYVFEGMVGLWRAMGDDRGVGVPWATRRVGTLLGSEGLTQDEYADTAIALTDVTLCSAERDTFRRWASEGSAEAARAVMELVIRTHCSGEPRPSSSEGSATRRVARWLADESRGGLAPPIPRAVVAGLLGMLPETFSRALAKLATQGAIRVNRKQIQVIDAARLLDEVGG